MHVPDIDERNKSSGFPDDQYKKSDQWATFKESRGGKANVGECEVQILHLQDKLSRKEKESLGHERRANALQEKLNSASTNEHMLDTELQLLRKESDTDKRLIDKYKNDHRLIEILIGLGCAGLGLLPTAFNIIEKGTDNHNTWGAIIVLAIVCLGFIFLPSKIIRGEK
jgi:hypothetical protein